MSIQVKPTTLGTAKVNAATDLPKGRWIGLKELDWTDQDGKNRKWEVAGRTTTAAGGVDGELPNQPGRGVRDLADPLPHSATSGRHRRDA